MNRLSRATLASLPSEIGRPSYDRSATRVGIVHLGIGAFHRAHQAVYVDDRLAAGETDWAICGASLRSPETADALTPQDGLYTLGDPLRTGRASCASSARCAGCSSRREPGALLDAMADPAVRIVSLTVTEKGYCHDPATGALREDHPDIRPTSRTRARRAARRAFSSRPCAGGARAGAAPFTVLCCDNLPENGRTVRRVVSPASPTLRDADLGRCVADEVAFPSTMVDRIVPATTEADRAAVAARLGVEDAWPVMTEPFTQWVIEDRFGRAAAVRGCGRRTRGRRRALRADEAAPPQRQPLDARLSRLPRRLRDRFRRDRPIRPSPASSAA